MAEKYQVSITKDPDNPPAVSVQINWNEHARSFTESRKYPSPQELISKTGREKLWREVQRIGGGAFAILVGASGITSPIIPLEGEAVIFVKTVAFLGGIGAIVGGIYMNGNAHNELLKVKAIQQQISNVIRIDYTVSPTGVTPPQS